MKSELGLEQEVNPFPENSNSYTIPKLEPRTRVLQSNAFNPLLSIPEFSHWSIRLESFISAPMATGTYLKEFGQRGQLAVAALGKLFEINPSGHWSRYETFKLNRPM